jgi:hypothetical protein
VQAIDPTLTIREVVLKPETLSPGKQGTISISVTNTARSSLQDVSVKLDLSEDALPIAPLGSATEKKIAVLNDGETATFSYNIIAYPSAQSGVYKIPVTLTFFDTLNNKTVSQETVGVVIGGEPEIEVVLDQHNLYRGFGTGTLPIKVINKGVVDVKFLTVTIGEGKYMLMSPESDYVGNLDSDDFETIDIDMMNKGTGNTLQVPLTVSYKDANNNDYEQSFEVSLALPPAPQQSGPGMTTYIIGIVIVGGILYVVYRRFKKRDEE